MILDGTKLAWNVYSELSKTISQLEKKPHLVAVLLWNSEASLRYIGQKRKFAEKVGMYFSLEHLPENTTEQELLTYIKRYNRDDDVSGYIIQLPLPKHIDTQKIIACIDPKKDVDGFHPVNLWKLLRDEKSGHICCTPAGIMHIFREHHIDLWGKRVVILGRSNIVWKPLAVLCINAGATVISCNSHSKNITDDTKNADIVISAIWKPYFLKASDVSPKAVLIDVGFTLRDGKIYGDIDTNSCLEQGNSITPVPGGVGPLTVAMLLSNTLDAHLTQLWNKKI